MNHQDHNWEWEEKPKEPIGVLGCLAWLSCLALWGLIFFAANCLWGG